MNKLHLVPLFLFALSVAPAWSRPAQLFVTSHRCLACHNSLTAPDGEDISIGNHWRASIMAHSGKDPYWHAAVRRETLDHPSASAHIQDECSACHMPMMRYEAHRTGTEGTVFANLPVPITAPAIGAPQPIPAAQLAADGVSCAMCHQIERDGLGTQASFTAGFVVDESTPLGERHAYGPFEADKGRSTIMRSASGMNPTRARHIQSAELCASCHTLYTTALGAQGEPVGELPEQVPYLEWRHSRYVDTDACQSCHMPEIETPTAVSSVVGTPRENVSRHTFRGGNFFMLTLFAENPQQLGVVAPREDLLDTLNRTRDHLQNSAAVLSITSAERRDASVFARLKVENLAGHKLPTAYPSRRAWIHFTVRDQKGEVVFESGRPAPDGAIMGNDNDRDPARFEPHHKRIESENEVQIYEAILAGPDGAVTTGLLTAVRFIKDNRLLPEGFEKTTAMDDIAVQGQASDDADFTGGTDFIEYLFPLKERSGPFTIEAELCYQPIAYRWARNLGEYAAEETKAFTRLYGNHASAATIVLARDSFSLR